jgi:hypothetical protein
VQWRVWPSVIGSDVGCRPVKVRDIGPPRFFFYSQTGGFGVLPYAEASWETLAQLSEDTLHGWLDQFVDRANEAEVAIGRL